MGARWSEEEKRYVRSNYRNMTAKEMATAIKRPVNSVFKFCRSERLDLTTPPPKKGDRLGRWELVTDRYLVDIGKQREGRVIARCQCGTEKEVRLSQLVNGEIESCGCIQKERARELCLARNTTHGMTAHPLFSVWSGMKGRCYRKSNIGFKDYGERGIKICDEWLDFETFAKWALSNGWEYGLTIERKDVNGNYEPSNCVFVTLKVNCNNKRNNQRITAFGETKTITQWSEDPRCQTKYSVLRDRLIKRGWSPEEAITTPTHRNN